MPLRIDHVCWTVAISLLVSFANSSGCGLCGQLYTVVNETQSIGSIAAFCNITVSALLQENSARPLLDGNSTVNAGESVQVPCSGNDAVNCGPCGFRYVSNSSENASTIAANCGLPVQSLIAVRQPNLSTVSSDELEVVSIPCAVEFQQPRPLSCGVCGSLITVTGSVTLDKIAGACNASVAGVEALNPAQGFSVYGATDLYVPCLGQDPVCGPCGNSYKVKSGDTYYLIAQACNVALSAMLEVNLGAPDPYTLNPGYLLHIPCAKDGKRYITMPTPSSSLSRLIDLRYHSFWHWWLCFLSLAILSCSLF